MNIVPRCMVYLLLAVSFHAIADTSEDIALKMVKTLQLGSNLAVFGKLAAFRTQTYGSIVKAKGAVNAERIMKEELLRLLPKYQEQWDKNLARSYLEYFTASELESIMNERENSAYINKLKSEWPKVGASMQSKSTPVLIDFVTEAVKAAYKKSLTAQ